MKVLFLSYCYPPKKYPRSVQISHLVQFLRDKFSLQVITSTAAGGDNSLMSFTPVDNVAQVKNSSLTTFIESARGHRLKQLLLPDPYYLWHFDLYNTASKAIEDSQADVVVTFGQPMSSHIAGIKLKKKFKKLKWIAHFSDPWVDNMFNHYNWWTRLINKYYQNQTFKRADKLVFTSQETIDLVMRNYPAAIVAKAECVPHSFNGTLYPSTVAANKELVISYIGNFYGDRKPDCLFKALQHIPASELESVRIDLIGASDSSIDHIIKSYGVQDIVKVVPAVDYLESLNMMRATDLLLIIDAPFANSPFLPSKLIDYIGANKPIFGITPEGTSQKLIEEMGFMVAHPNNPQEIASKLSKVIVALKAQQKFEIPSHIINRYSVAVVGQQMQELISSI